MTLIALGEALQGAFVGKPAKHMTTLIARLISRKMPAGFNQNSMQDYICSRWGFSKAHSLVPICLAITIEPTARLANAQKVSLFRGRRRIDVLGIPRPGRKKLSGLSPCIPVGLNY